MTVITEEYAHHSGIAFVSQNSLAQIAQSRNVQINAIKEASVTTGNVFAKVDSVARAAKCNCVLMIALTKEAVIMEFVIALKDTVVSFVK